MVKKRNFLKWGKFGKNKRMPVIKGICINLNLFISYWLLEDDIILLICERS